MLSNFDGAYYVYKHVLHPCISLDVEDLINQFKERMEYFSTRIKVVAEEKRQEKENVGETLHELLKLLHETAANKVWVQLGSNLELFAIYQNFIRYSNLIFVCVRMFNLYMSLYVYICSCDIKCLSA